MAGQSSSDSLLAGLGGGEPWDRANHRYVPLGWESEFEGREVQESLRGRHGL